MNVRKTGGPAAAWWALSLLAAVTLAGCGPRTIRTLILPETYAVSSTITFRNPDGSSTTQTQQIKCEILDTRDALNGGLTTRAVGDRHWRQLPNGAIMIVGDMTPCPWLGKPAPGQSRRAEPHFERSPANSGEQWATTFVFDDAERPMQVDVLDTQAMAIDPGAGFDRPVLFVGRRGRAPSLTSAFPGLRSLVSDHTSESFVQSDLSDNAFSGVVARVYELPEGERCGDGASEGGAVLAPNDACQNIRDCEQASPMSVCPLYLGALRVEFNADYTRANLSSRAAPDRLFWMRYLRNDVIRARYPMTAPAAGWQPELCYDGHCTSESDARFYDPAARRLIWVSVRERAFHPADFTSRIRRG